jgi:hypothetical protein
MQGGYRLQGGLAPQGVRLRGFEQAVFLQPGQQLRQCQRRVGRRETGMAGSSRRPPFRRYRVLAMPLTQLLAGSLVSATICLAARQAARSDRASLP